MRMLSRYLWPFGIQRQRGMLLPLIFILVANSACILPFPVSPEKIGEPCLVPDLGVAGGVEFDAESVAVVVGFDSDGELVVELDVDIPKTPLVFELQKTLISKPRHLHIVKYDADGEAWYKTYDVGKDFYLNYQPDERIENIEFLCDGSFVIYLDSDYIIESTPESSETPLATKPATPPATDTEPPTQPPATKTPDEPLEVLLRHHISIGVDPDHCEIQFLLQPKGGNRNYQFLKDNGDITHAMVESPDSHNPGYLFPMTVRRGHYGLPFTIDIVSGTQRVSVVGWVRPEYTGTLCQ